MHYTAFGMQIDRVDGNASLPDIGDWEGVVWGRGDVNSSFSLRGVDN